MTQALKAQLVAEMEFKNLVTMLRGAFPDLKFTIEHLLGEGDTVVGHWTARGTHTGTALKTLRGDIPAQGKPFVIDGMSWLRFKDGKFVEARINEDTLGLLQQIGAIPGPPRPEPSSTEANKAMVRRYFSGKEPLGNLLTVTFGLRHGTPGLSVTEDHPREIVGVGRI